MSKRDIKLGITPGGFKCKHMKVYEHSMPGGGKRLTCACGQLEDTIPLNMASHPPWDDERKYCPECEGAECSSCII